jgi:hypothetical protein
VRLSRFIRQSSSGEDAVPLRRAIAWALVGGVMLLGLVLYFKYERLVLPLVG